MNNEDFARKCQDGAINAINAHAEAPAPPADTDGTCRIPTAGRRPHVAPACGRHSNARGARLGDAATHTSPTPAGEPGNTMPGLSSSPRAARGLATPLSFTDEG